MSKKINQVLFYYGYPNAINGSWDITKSAQQIAQYDIWIIGDEYYSSVHEAYADTVAIVNKLREIKPELEIFGYIPCANYHDPDDVYQDEPLTVEQLKARIDAWKKMGLDGIFLDEWGYDYKNDRARQNEIVQYLKDNNLIPFYNSWNDTYTFSSKDITIGWLDNYRPNPNQLKPVKVPKSYFLIEDMFWGINDGTHKQEHGDVWTVYRPYEYFYNGQKELSGRTFFDEYKSEPVALDGILKKTEPTEEAAKMRTISIYMSLMLNIKYLAFGDEDWGSNGNCYHWTVPPLLVNKPRGLTDVSLVDESALTWEWNCTIDGVKLKALWGDSKNVSMTKGTREVYVNDVKIENAWKTIAPLYDLRQAEMDINDKFSKNGGYLHDNIKFHIKGKGVQFGKDNTIYLNDNNEISINGKSIMTEDKLSFEIHKDDDEAIKVISKYGSYAFFGNQGIGDSNVACYIGCKETSGTIRYIKIGKDDKLIYSNRLNSSTILTTNTKHITLPQIQWKLSDQDDAISLISSNGGSIGYISSRGSTPSLYELKLGCKYPDSSKKCELSIKADGYLELITEKGKNTIYHTGFKPSITELYHNRKVFDVKSLIPSSEKFSVKLCRVVLDDKENMVITIDGGLGYTGRNMFEEAMIAHLRLSIVNSSDELNMALYDYSDVISNFGAKKISSNTWDIYLALNYQIDNALIECTKSRAVTNNYILYCETVEADPLMDYEGYQHNSTYTLVQMVTSRSSNANIWGFPIYHAGNPPK